MCTIHVGALNYAGVERTMAAASDAYHITQIEDLNSRVITSPHDLKLDDAGYEVTGS